MEQTLSQAEDRYAPCRSSRWRSLCVLGTVCLVTLAACQRIQGESLDAVVEAVSRAHPVGEIAGAALEDSLTARAERYVLFDVRPGTEFEVGHLNAAIRVDPDIDGDQFLAHHRKTVEGKTAVFYCSVGYRSSILVERILEATRDSMQLLNLQGGIFKWYNEGRAVYDSTGVSERVHPYNVFWGKLLDPERGRNKESERRSRAKD